MNFISLVVLFQDWRYLFSCIIASCISVSCTFYYTCVRQLQSIWLEYLWSLEKNFTKNFSIGLVIISSLLMQFTLSILKRGKNSENKDCDDNHVCIHFIPSLTS